MVQNLKKLVNIFFPKCNEWLQKKRFLHHHSKISPINYIATPESFEILFERNKNIQKLQFHQKIIFI